MSFQIVLTHHGVSTGVEISFASTSFQVVLDLGVEFAKKAYRFVGMSFQVVLDLLIKSQNTPTRFVSMSFQVIGNYFSSHECHGCFFIFCVKLMCLMYCNVQYK